MLTQENNSKNKSFDFKENEMTALPLHSSMFQGQIKNNFNDNEFIKKL